MEPGYENPKKAHLSVNADSHVNSKIHLRVIVFATLYLNYKSLNTEECVWPHFLYRYLFVKSVVNPTLNSSNKDQDGGARQILTDYLEILVFHKLNFQRDSIP